MVFVLLNDITKMAVVISVSDCQLLTLYVAIYVYDLLKFNKITY